jgi:hypothetical protein
MASKQHILIRNSLDNILMWCRIPLALAVTLWCAGAVFGEPKPSPQANLVANGGFEQSGAGWRFVFTGANATDRWK